jgi:hypothetical protein
MALMKIKNISKKEELMYFYKVRRLEQLEFFIQKFLKTSN